MDYPLSTTYVIINIHLLLIWNQNSCIVAVIESCIIIVMIQSGLLLPMLPSMFIAKG